MTRVTSPQVPKLETKVNPTLEERREVSLAERPVPHDSRSCHPDGKHSLAGDRGSPASAVRTPLLPPGTRVKPHEHTHAAS